MGMKKILTNFETEVESDVEKMFPLRYSVAMEMCEPLRSKMKRQLYREFWKQNGLDIN